MVTKLVAFALLCGFLGISSRSDGQSRPRRSTPSRRPAGITTPTAKPTLAIGVVPFRNGLGDSPSVNYGIGIADSVTNSLKNVASLSALDVDVMAEAMRRNADLDVVAKDTDAVKLGSELGLIAIVVGSDQQIGQQIRIDARVLNVATGRTMTTAPISLTASFPDGYFDLLSKLSLAVTKSLQVPTTPGEVRQMDRVSKTTTSISARQAYDKGLAEMSLNNTDGLKEAVRLFGSAISLDPDFGLAYAAKADAETRLLEMGKTSGSADDTVGKDAVRDAEQSVQKTHGLGRAYRALANAHGAAGQYAEAEQAARSAVATAPNDASAWLALSRAQGRGDFADDDALERAFRLQPGVSFIIAQCPRVTVVNNTAGELTVTFSPSIGAGKPYPPIKLPAATSRHIPLLPGLFLVDAQCPDADLVEEKKFDADTEYRLTYEGGACSENRYPAFLFQNRLLTTITVQISGQSNQILKECKVPGHSKRRVVVVPGSYTSLCGGRRYTAFSGSISTRREKRRNYHFSTAD